MTSKKYESYEDLISGLENEGLCDDEDADIGSLDDEDLDVLMPARHQPRPVISPKPVKKRSRK